MKNRIWPRRVMAPPTAKLQNPSSKLPKDPKRRVPTDASAQAPGAWSLGLLWCLVFGVWCLSQSFSRQVLFLLRPVFRCVFQVQFAGQNPSDHLVKHRGLLRPVTRVGRRNQRRGRPQDLEHSFRQRVGGEFPRVPACSEVAQSGKLPLIFPRQEQFEKL